MHNKLNNRHLQQRGLTLVELIAALGIAAIIVAGALSLYRSANDSQVATSALQDLTAIQQAARAHYQGVYPAEDNTIKTNLSTFNRWPATATKISTGAGTTTATYKLTLNNVSRSACLSILASTKGWRAIKVGDTAVGGDGNPNAANAAAACTADGVNLIFEGD